MARVLIEYFKPDPFEPGTFPLGVIAQDDENLLYRPFDPPRFNVEKFPEFHLESRGRTMSRNVLIPSFSRRLANGDMEEIPVTDPGFLEALAARGDGNFRYGRVWVVDDMDAESVARSIASLPDEHLDQFAQKDKPSALSQLERLVG